MNTKGDETRYHLSPFYIFVYSIAASLIFPTLCSAPVFKHGGECTTERLLLSLVP